MQGILLLVQMLLLLLQVVVVVDLYLVHWHWHLLPAPHMPLLLPHCQRRPQCSVPSPRHNDDPVPIVKIWVPEDKWFPKALIFGLGKSFQMYLTFSPKVTL